MVYIDTNILIYLLEGHRQYGKPVAKMLEQLTAQNEPLITSAITITEFMAGTSAASPDVLYNVPRLRFIALDAALAEHAAKLQKQNSSLQIGDAIHIATAVQSGAILLFTNDKFMAKTASKHIKIKSLD